MCCSPYGMTVCILTSLCNCLSKDLNAMLVDAIRHTYTHTHTHTFTLIFLSTIHAQNTYDSIVGTCLPRKLQSLNSKFSSVNGNYIHNSFTHSFVHSFFHSFIHSFVPSFLPSFLPSFIHSFIYSFFSLSYERPVTLSTTSSLQSAIQCFLFQFPVHSLLLTVIQVSAYVFFLVFPLFLSLPLSSLQ
jgi:hypothetical protein